MTLWVWTEAEQQITIQSHDTGGMLLPREGEGEAVISGYKALTQKCLHALVSLWQTQVIDLYYNKV